jgi:hypothetical protein
MLPGIYQFNRNVMGCSSPGSRRSWMDMLKVSMMVVLAKTYTGGVAVDVVQLSLFPFADDGDLDRI